MKRLGVIYILLFIVIASLSSLQYSVELVDTYGDGWNGGNLTVNVNGTAVLSELTIESGGGPQNHNFQVTYGDLIETVYTAGSWANENEYSLKNEENNVCAESGSGGAIPENISYTVPLEGTPAPPLLLAPTDTQVNCTNPVNLVWSIDENTYISDVLIADNPEFSQETYLGDVVSPYQVNLEAGTRYYWKVKARGYNGLETESSVFSFITEFDVIGEFPYTEDFEDDWYNSPSAPLAWQQIVVSGTNNWVQSSVNPHSGSYCAKAPYHTNGGEHLLITPSFALEENTSYLLKFWIKGHSTYPTDLKVQIGESNYDGEEDFVEDLAYYVTGDNMPTEWTEETLEISGYNGNYSIAFRAIDDDGLYVFLDDVEFSEPYPILLEAQANIGTINLTWSPPTENTRLRNLLGYNVYRDNLQINASILSNTEYEDNDITHGDIYEYYVQALYQDEETKESNRVQVLAVEYYLEGEGTEENPYIVEDLDDLYCLSSTISYWQSGLYIEQMADIDATETQIWNDGLGFSPIGNYYDKFEANYNGNGCVISNLYINRPETSRIALFGEINNGSITNVGLTNVNFTGDQNVGALVGVASYSDISCCYSTGLVTGTYTIGGLMGSCDWDSSLENSYSLVNVTSTNYRSGGLVGTSSSSTISNCFSAGLVDGNTGVGGLVGVSSSTITNCFWDTESSNQASSQGGTGLPSNQMKDPLTYMNAGWDFSGEVANGEEEIWTINGNDYPHLSSEFIAPPRNLTASIANVGEIHLTWSAPEPELVSGRAILGYNIYRNDIQINESTIETTSFSDTNVQNNQVYSYYVSAIFHEGQSIGSNTVEINYSLLLGQGTENSPYLIENLYDLFILSQLEYYWSDNYHFEQTTDIDASDTQNWDDGAGFSPIGTEDIPFIGTYNGNHYSISNLYIDRVNTDNVGLFGKVYNAYLENITLIDVFIKARSRVGSLAGISTNSDYYGCSASGQLIVSTQPVNNNSYSGGLIGRNSSSGGPSTISSCYTSVYITAPANARRIGGITGFMLSGWSDVTGYPMLIENCYSHGACYGGDEIGGLVGVVQVHANGQLITIKDSYSTAYVDHNQMSGGVIGRRIGTSETINCFWNDDTSGVISGVGDGDETGIEQKDTEELQTLSTFIDAGWDFQAETANGQEDNWTFVAFDYPHLAWEGYTNQLTSPPLNLQASVEDGSIILTWSPPQGQASVSRAFLGYNVYRDDIQINAQTLSNMYYTDTDLVHDQIYTYYVRALYDEGESEASNTIEAQAIYLILSGQGTESNPYLINNLTDLFILSQKDTYWTSGTYIEQTADIDASDTQNWDGGAGFSPIGINWDNAFKGNFNGNNFVISYLYIDRPNRNYVGLFGNNRNAVITNACIENTDITGRNRVGGLLGQTYQSIISNSYSNGLVSGDSEVGGLVGFTNETTINNSYFSGNVSGASEVGGLVGSANGTTISNSYTSVSVDGNSHIGGLVGYADGITINDSHSSDNVSGDSMVGGLVGFTHVTAINNSYFSGNVNGDSVVGGLVGALFMCSTISNSYAFGSVSSSSEAGGLIGHTFDSTVSNSYAFGSVSSSSEAGGLIGHTFDSTVSNSFWDIQTSNQTTSAGGTGLTTSQMQTLSTYLDAGWDFQTETDNGTDDIWTFVANDYPHLAWEGFTNQLTSPPVNLTSTLSDSVVEFIWNKPQNQSVNDRSFLGYNVYCDGQLLNETALSDTTYSYSFDESSIINYEHSYYVTALYDEGESEASNTIDVILLQLVLSGQGSESNPYLIEDLADLYILSKNNDYWESQVFLEQTADIDASNTQYWNDGAGFSPIGINWDNAFKGNYNGNNFVISSLYIDRPNRDYVGLFGNNRNAIITNACIENAEIHGDERVGGLLGQSYQSIISNSYSNGLVSGDSEVGGLVGFTNETTINNSYFSGNVSGASEVGGLVGSANGTTISNSYTSVSVDGNSHIGGLVGSADGITINNSHSSDNVSGDSEVGGLVGVTFESTINNSYAFGSVIGESEVGGLVGASSMYSIISNSYSTGLVSGNYSLGGLVGVTFESTINNSYALGSVSGNYSLGGLVGALFMGSTISNSYSTGLVSGNSEAGGLIGYSQYSTVSNSFWDIQTSNQTTSAGGTSLTTSQMQTLSTYLDAGWDFADEINNGIEDIWTFVANDYPHLTWEYSFVNAMFEADVTRQLTNQVIQFSSNSTGQIDYYEWDFDNDGFIDSYDENPSYSYSQEGIYTVALTVSNDNQESDTLILEDYIEIVSCDIQAGLFAHYPFTSNANDESGNLLNADVYGASLTTDRFGNEDSAYEFDGVDDYIDCPDGFADFSNGITISYWSYQEAFNSWSRIIDFGNGSRSDNIILTPAALGSNSLQFQVYRGSSSSNIRLPNVIDLNNWTFWLAEIDVSGYAKVYKNNVLIGQGNIGIPNNIERINNYIGRSNWAADGYYQGKIDDLRIYNRLLFAQEREQLYSYSETIDSPTNLTIVSQGEQLVLSWEEVIGATSYKIFASDFPNGEFVDVTAQGIFDDQASISYIPYSSKSNSNNGSARLRNNLSWIIDSNSGRKFYKIKAVQ